MTLKKACIQARKALNGAPKFTTFGGRSQLDVWRETMGDPERVPVEVAL